MTNAKTDTASALLATETTKAIVTLSAQVGTVAGTIGGFRDEIARMHSELIHMRTAMDMKDEQNMVIVKNYHEQNVTAIKDNANVLVAHKDDDNKNFHEVKKFQYIVTAAFSTLLFILSGAWAVVTFLLPYLKEFYEK